MAGADTQSLHYPCKATAGEGEQPEDENPEDETPEDDCEDLSYEFMSITYTCSDAKETFGCNALVAEHCPTTCETEGCGGSTNVDQKPEGEEDDKANDCSKADAYGPTCDSHSGCSDWQPLPTDFICVDNGNGECMAGADTQSLWYPCKASAGEGERPERPERPDIDLPIGDRCTDLEVEFDLNGRQVSCTAAQSECDNTIVMNACPATCEKPGCKDETETVEEKPENEGPGNEEP